MALKKPRINLWFSSKDGKWYFNIQGKNGKIQAASEGYSTESNARRGIRSLKWNLWRAKVVEITDQIS
jgi:uncharacterized protein YegP (UPF0339 family)